MSDSKQKAIATRRRSRLLERAEQAGKQAQNSAKQAVQAPPADTGPRVVNVHDDTPAWCRGDWKPATSTNTSELLARHRALQAWAELRARYGGGGYDDMGNRIDRAPAGYHPLFGWKL